MITTSNIREWRDDLDAAARFIGFMEENGAESSHCRRATTFLARVVRELELLELEVLRHQDDRLYKPKPRSKSA